MVGPLRIDGVVHDDSIRNGVLDKYSGLSLQSYPETSRALLEGTFTSLGEQMLKNIDRPIQAYTVTPQIGAAPASLRAADTRLDLPKFGGVSIAVLPFVNLGRDPTQEYLITELSRIKDCRSARTHGVSESPEKLPLIGPNWQGYRARGSGDRSAPFARRRYRSKETGASRCERAMRTAPLNERGRHGFRLL